MSSKIIFDCPEILGESLIDLTEATKYLFPVKCSRATIERWVRRGSRGIRLETVLIANRRYTSKQAVQRFLANQQYTEPEKAEVVSTQSNMSQKAINEALQRYDLPAPLESQN